MNRRLTRANMTFNPYAIPGLLFNGAGGGGGGDAAAAAAAAAAATAAAEATAAADKVAADKVAADKAAAENDQGFPANTPVKDMQPGEQTAYWKHQSRKHEDRVGTMSDYAALKAQSAELAELKRQGMTENEKAIADARAEGHKAGTTEARTTASPQLVSAEFRAAVAGRIDADRLATILEPLDLTKFLTATGEVDAAKVTTYVDGIVPAGSKKWPDMGQGHRQTTKTTGVSAGAAMFAADHAKK